MTGFIYNDVVDIELDRLAKKERPIALGLLSKRTALLATAGISLSSILTAFMLFELATSSLLLITSIAVLLYSHASTYLPLVKGPYVGALAVFPFMVGYSVGKGEVHLGALSVVFSYICFREMLLDIADRTADLAYGKRTIAAYLPRESLWVPWLGMMCSLMLGFAVIDGYQGQILISLAVAAQLFFLILSNRDLALAIRGTRIVMLIGVGAACLSG